MNYKSKAILIIVFVTFCFNGCGSITGNKSDFNKISVSFSMGEGKQKVSFDLDLKNSEVVFETDKIVIKNSISDFTLPFNRSKTPLTRSVVAGDEVMNEVELISRNNKSAIIFRLTTKGEGGGKGEIGVSLIAA